VLNQIDCVAASQLPGLEERLRAIEPEVPIVRATQARVDPALLRPVEAPSRGRLALPQAPHDHTLHEAFSAEVIEVERGVAEDELVARSAPSAPCARRASSRLRAACDSCRASAGVSS